MYVYWEPKPRRELLRAKGEKAHERKDREHMREERELKIQRERAYETEEREHHP